MKLTILKDEDENNMLLLFIVLVLVLVLVIQHQQLNYFENEDEYRCAEYEDDFHYRIDFSGIFKRKL